VRFDLSREISLFPPLPEHNQTSTLPSWVDM
jgi:hypothetical protein